MNQLNRGDVVQYVEDNIGDFHQKRIKALSKLKLEKVLKRKNPYMFKAKYITTAEEIVKQITSAHLSSNEETIFGDWLEGLAIFINKKVFSGWKSGISGIDLEFNYKNKRYIIAIKSGPNWGNSSQIKKMETDFTSAKRTLRTSGSNLHIVAINGCCYGKQKNPDKGDYYKYCGQVFWEFISGDSNLYKDIIEPLGHQARERNDEFQRAYSRMINKFTKEFVNNYCLPNGDIDWNTIVEINSKK